MLTLQFLRFEGRNAILFHEEVGEIAWPIKDFPEDIQVGESVNLFLESQKSQEEQQYNRMRRLLEELIN